MSGGSFDYDDYHISQIANQIEEHIVQNNKEQTYSPETIQRLNEAVDLLRKAAVLVHRIDYLLAGDHGEDSFHEELKKDLDLLAKWEKIL
jgi:hypothetical protein